MVQYRSTRIYKGHVKAYLPTQPEQPQQWEEGAIPSLKLAVPADDSKKTAAKSATSAASRASSPGVFGSHQAVFVVCLVLFSLISYFLITRYVLTAVVIEGRSMSPTLVEGERFILDRWSCHFRNLERGDLVVIKDPGHKDYAVKRIVGLPGESLFLKDGAVLLNGKRLLETYLPTGTKTFSPDRKDRLILVGKNQYFVMGDNRANSEDSRFYGAVSRERILGTLFKQQ
jgi:signal peptidase I